MLLFSKCDSFKQSQKQTYNHIDIETRNTCKEKRIDFCHCIVHVVAHHLRGVSNENWQLVSTLEINLEIDVAKLAIRLIDFALLGRAFNKS